jgi:2-hydroxy-3-keto-5-methylthiopentenyl-1-phosphate phosphatase
MEIVLDWDGTVTEVDSLHLVLLEFGDTDIYDEAETRLGRELTLHEVIALEFATIRVPLGEVVDWVRETVSLRRGFTEFAQLRRPLVVSSGFHELIQPVLEREGSSWTSARTASTRDRGLAAVFRNDEPCPVCREPCKRADVAGYDEFAYVGDGFSDRCVALAATRVFARDGLADYLAERGVPFDRFEDFHEIAKLLEGHALVPTSRTRGPKR